MEPLIGDNRCFGCGPDNPHGLKLRFQVDAQKRTAFATFTPPFHTQGYQGLVHGGILATALDEAMVRLAFDLGYRVVTARLRVRYRAPLRVGETATLTGRITRVTRRGLSAEAALTQANGAVVAEATATLVPLSGQAM